MACKRSSSNSALYPPASTATYSASPNIPAALRPTRMRFSPSDLAALYSVDMASLYTLGPHASQSHRNRVCNYTAKTGSSDRSDAFMAVLGPMYHTPNDVLIMLVLNDKHAKDLFDDPSSDSCKTRTQHSVAFGVYNNDTGMLSFPHLSQSHPVTGNVGKFSWRFGSMAFAGSCLPGVDQAATLQSLFANMSNTKFVFTRMSPTSCSSRTHQKTMVSLLSERSIICWLANMVNVEDLTCLFESGCSCSDVTAESMWQDAVDTDAFLTHVLSGRGSMKGGCAGTPCGASPNTAVPCSASPSTEVPCGASPSTVVPCAGAESSGDCAWFSCGASGSSAMR